jgi:hypothetical protein
MKMRTLGWLGLFAGIAVAWACGGWSPDEGLVAGDTALSRPFETNFQADLVAYHGPAKGAHGRFDEEKEVERRRLAASEALLVELRRATDSWTSARREKFLLSLIHI